MKLYYIRSALLTRVQRVQQARVHLLTARDQIYHLTQQIRILLAASRHRVRFLYNELCQLVQHIYSVHDCVYTCALRCR